MKKVEIRDEFITLGQFCKYVDLISNGGEVKYFLANTEIKVNNEFENRRGKKLYKNDIIEVLGQEYIIC